MVGECFVAEEAGRFLPEKGCSIPLSTSTFDLNLITKRKEQDYGDEDDEHRGEG